MTEEELEMLKEIEASEPAVVFSDKCHLCGEVVGGNEARFAFVRDGVSVKIHLECADIILEKCVTMSGSYTLDKVMDAARLYRSQL